MWILNFRERKERASESEINWTDQTPGTFRSRLVFKPVYPNSPNTRENVRERVVAVSYRPQGWSFCLPQSAQDKWPTVSGRNLILYSNCFSICFINGNWKYLYFLPNEREIVVLLFNVITFVWRMYFVKTVDSVIKDRIRMSNIYNWDELCAVWQLKIYIFFYFEKL